MKPLAFNLKDAKKIRGDKSKSTFRLKDGHEITVAHCALPAIQRKQLEKLPVHMDVGGEAGSDSSDSAPQDVPADNSALAALFGGLSQIPNAIGSAYDQTVGKNDQYLQDNLYGHPSDPKPSSDSAPQDVPADNSALAVLSGGLSQIPNAIGSAYDQTVGKGDQYLQDNLYGHPSDPKPEAPPAPIDETPDAKTDLPGAGTPVGQTGTNLNSELSNTYAKSGNSAASAVALGQKAIKEQQGVESALAKSNADTTELDLNDRQNLLDGFQNNTREFQEEQKKFINDLRDQKINPNHYVESLSGAQKASTAIGLFLGGWGSGYTHQGNPGLDFLNKQIDRDIEGQKMRMDQSKTLLGANQALYHDNVLALNATRAQMNDIYAHEIQLNADKLGTPAAKARADAATAKFQLENQGLLQQNAIRATALHSISQGGAGMDALTLADAGLIDRKTAEKEQASINAQKNAVTAAKDLFSQISKEQTTLNLANPQSYSRVAALKAQLVNTVMNASASKRLTRESVEAEINPLLIGTGNTQATRDAKLSSLLNIIGQHADPTPVMSRLAPKALPTYPFQAAAQAQQHKVGDTLYVRGQKVQIVDQKGNYVPVK